MGLTYLSALGRHHVVYTGEAEAGTINQVILIDARLASTAAVRAATLATGASMDTIVVASTGRGPFSRYAGTSTLVGHLIGQAVYEAVAGGIRLEQGATTSP